MTTIAQELLEVIEKPQKTSSKFDAKVELNVEPGGINASLKGIVYQVKTLLLALQSSRSKNFTIGTEIEEAACFDDALIHIPDEGTRFVQSKFRNNTFDLEMNHFFDGSNRNYCLLKYFKAFLNLKNIFGNVRDVIICTNNKFSVNHGDFIDLCDNQDFRIRLKRISEKDEIFGNFQGRYKLDRNCEETIRFLKNKFIGTELLKCSKKDRNCDYTFLKAFRSFLSSQIFDESTKKFKNSFLESTDLEIVTLRKVLSSNLNIELTRLSHLNEIYAQKTKENEENLMENLLEFMDKFILVVGFTEEDIDDQLVPFFQEQFQLIDVTFIKETFEEKLMSWVKDIQTGDYFDAHKFETLIREIQQNLVMAHRLIEKSSAGFQGIFPEFKGHEMKILLDSKDKVLLVETAEGETFYGSCRVYQELKNQFADTYLFLKASSSTKSSVQTLEAFESKDSFKILLLECDLSGKPFELQYQLQKVLSENPEKKLILIFDHSEVTSGFKNSAKRVKFGKVKLSELTEKSLNEHLQKTIKFQEEKVKLNEIIDSTSIPSIFLKDLDATKSISQSVIHSKNYNPELYIDRTLIHKNIIHHDVFNRKNRLLEDRFVFDEESFVHSCDVEFGKNIHLLEKLVGRDDYRWIKSAGSIFELRKFIVPEDGTTMGGSFEGEKKSFVLVDVAGMGESYTAFVTLANTLNQIFNLRQNLLAQPTRRRLKKRI